MLTVGRHERVLLFLNDPGLLGAAIFTVHLQLFNLAVCDLLGGRRYCPDILKISGAIALLFLLAILAALNIGSIPCELSNAHSRAQNPRASPPGCDLAHPSNRGS